MSPYDSIKTMTEEQDKDLRNWKSQNTKDKDAAKYNYGSLCRALFGKGVRVPDNHVYHYLVAEYTINPDSRNLGEENLRYVRQRQFVAQPGSTASPSHQAHEDDHHHHHNQQQPTLNPHYQQQPTLNPHYQQHPNPIQHTINPLQLDDSPQPLNWAVPKTAPDQDSGYDSWASREPAPQRENSGAYMDMNSVWGTETVWPQPNEDVASTGTFFQDALYQPPWDLENSDAPPG
ncbi:hypothetical protein F4802DRAFT_46295 [Xylaria palmicola]|nr:hypothetical protein F4802DRAFT_46295 [Xylaria palmicola]